MNNKISIFLFLMTLFTLNGNTKASAQSCSVSATDVNFGIVNVIANVPYDTSSRITITCIGTPGATIRMCSSLGSGSGGTVTGHPRTMEKSGNLLDFNLYTNPSLTNIFGSFVWPMSGSYPGLRTLITIPPAGSITQVLTVYARVLAGQTGRLPENYKSNFDGAHTRFTYDYNYLAPCSTTPLFSKSANFNVTATISRDCLVSATDMNFGSVSDLSTNVDSTSTISARCSISAPYSVSLSNGLTGTSAIARKMTQGAVAITYGLYRDNLRSLPFGNNIGTNTVAATGTGFNQSITVYGRVPPQATPAAATYTDTITVTVTY